MKKNFLILVVLATNGLFANSVKKVEPKPIYLDATKSVDQRVTDLMSKMTIDEKVAQMCQYLAPKHISETNKKFKGRVPTNNDTNGTYPTVTIDSIYHLVEMGMIGSFLHVLTPEESNQLQSLAQKSRLKIPLLLGIDAIHGAGYSTGTTIYPTAITQASSFEPELVKQASQQAALEIRAMGSAWTFTPNVDVCRDPRWGRIGETFGEDPYLVSRMGIATIKGLQGDKLNSGNVAACAKHLVAGGSPINGLNAAPMEVSPYTLNDIYLYSFRKVLEETDLATIMVAHNELNGVPCHADKNLMTDIIRNKFNFKGFYVSDWDDIARMFTLHKYSSSLMQAYSQTVNAGMDMHMHGPGFQEGIIKLLNDNKLNVSQINKACARILETKFRLGLFENPYTDLNTTKKVVFNTEHQKMALKLAEQSIVLLKNDGLLPLDINKYKHILITGPNADSQSVLGDWAMKQPDENVTTVLEGVRQVLGTENVIFHNVSTNVRFHDSRLIDDAAELAKKSDLAIVVVGENTMRYDIKKLISSGENYDRMNIDLLGDQEELVKRIQVTGIPTVVILVGGRPLAVNWISENVSALVQAWEPGSLGGQAIANVLTGKVNPSGKLPVTIPRSTGQIQMIYNYKPTQLNKSYVDGQITPLYPFGYGLSYTKFTITNLAISKTEMSKSDSLIVTADITNVGTHEGAEVVQLYIHDLYSMPTRPVKELKDFVKINLLPGEKKTVQFTINPEKLSFTKQDMTLGVEEGDFELLLGTSSADKDLKRKNFTIK
jgi:beta-glucosidase